MMRGRTLTEGRTYKTEALRQAYDDGVADAIEHVLRWVHKNLKVSKVTRMRTRIIADGPTAQAPKPKQLAASNPSPADS